jgi:hypothetical protein
VQPSRDVLPKLVSDEPGAPQLGQKIFLERFEQTFNSRFPLLLISTRAVVAVLLKLSNAPSETIDSLADTVTS